MLNTILTVSLAAPGAIATLQGPAQANPVAAPAAPAQPLPSYGQAQPGQPAQPTQPTQPVQPTQPGQPAQPTQPTQPVAQPVATQPAQPVAQPAPVGQAQPPTNTAQSNDVVIGPPINDEHIRSINRKWRGLGLGFHNGLYGRSFAQGLKIDIPFGRRVGQFMGMRLQGVFVHPPAGTEGQYDPVLNAGIEFFGRGPVWLGLFRVYGGGGAWIGSRVNPTAMGKVYQFTGGGHVGAEFLVAPRMSFTFEIGGQGPGHGLRNDDAGANVMGGFMVYLGDILRR